MDDHQRQYGLLWTKVDWMIEERWKMDYIRHDPYHGWMDNQVKVFDQMLIEPIYDQKWLRRLVIRHVLFHEQSL